MVDREASTLVIGPEDVKAAKDGEPDQNRNHKLADGNIIHNKGHNKCKVLTVNGQERRRSASVTDVGKPLLSVSQVVLGGSTVVFSPNNSYIDSLGGKRIPIERQGNIYTLKLWVPKDQDASFQGQACTRL